MKSPFQFGKIVTGSAFVNRKKEKERLASNIENNLHTILVSPRRWGKSSLVKATAARVSAKNKNIKFCFIDLFSIRSEEDFYSVYTQAIVKATTTKVEEWIQLTQQFLKRVVPKISMGLDPVHDFEIKFDVKAATDNYADILHLPEKLAKNKKLKIVVCIDEFQNLITFQDPEAFQKRLRSVWQHHQHVTYCLYGSKKHMLMHIFEDKSMPFYKFGDVFYMPKIGKPHLLSFIIEGFEKTHKQIKKEFAEEIIDTMQCHPYYVQQLAYLVWINTSRNVTREIVHLAIDELLNQNAMLYQKEADGLSNTQVNFLKALVEGVQEQLSSQEVIQKYKLGTSANVVKIKEVLDKKEIIDVLLPKPEFIDPAFELWFKKYFK